MNALKEWWNNASPRDQLAVLLLSLALLLYILFMGVLGPLSTMAEEQAKRTLSQQGAFERVKDLAAQVQASRGDTAGENSGQSAERIVENSLNQHSLRVSGFDASGRSGIRVRFDRIAYDKLLTWLADLELNQALQLKDISVAASGEVGVVSASVLIQK